MEPDSLRHGRAGIFGPLAILTLTAALVTAALAASLPLDGLFPDVICYWSAAEILAAGRSPYDVESQTSTQHKYGWRKEARGMGIYDFLPYYYPPWFALLWVPVLPLGYPAARLLWFFLNVEMVLVSGYLLRPAVPRTRAIVLVLLAALPLFTLACCLLGQTAILVLFLAVLSWRLLEGGHERFAGVALAWLTIKPQLTVVLLLAVLLRLARQRRWPPVAAFIATLSVFMLTSTLIIPSWLSDMVRAPTQTPSPTEHYPWIGNAWLLVLRSVGLGGWLLAVSYLAISVPFLVIVLRRAFDPGHPLVGLVGAALLAAFFVAPYARHYDFPVLVVPLVALAGRGTGSWFARGLPAAFLVVPYVQQYILVQYKPHYNPDGLFVLEATYFWVPVVLAATWLASTRAANIMDNVVRKSCSATTDLCGEPQPRG
jgi:hypothetical protein